MNEKISSGEACKKLVKKILENFKLPYITITPTFSVCPKHGYLNGEHKYCPCCAEEDCTQCCEVYTRVMGYHRPVSEFNRGKQSEHNERVHFKEVNTSTSCCMDSGCEDECDSGCGCC